MKAISLFAQINVDILGGLTPTYWRVTNRDEMGSGSGTMQRCEPAVADYVMPHGYHDEQIHRYVNQFAMANLVSKEEVYAKLGCTLAELETRILPR